MADEDGLPASLLLHIFSYLGPSDLCRVAATCTLWHRLATCDANKQWEGFFSDRWHVRCGTLPGGHIRWSSRFSKQMHLIASWKGKWKLDELYGHRGGCRALKMSGGLVVTGSTDRTVRLWDLNSGLPLACSRPHRGTVRCVALDEYLLASGSTDHTIRVYASTAVQNPGSHSSGSPLAARAALAPPVVSGQTGTGSCARAQGVYGQMQTPPPFNLEEPCMVLRAHTGPVSALCLSEHALYSGSWDCTVRTYTRGEDPRALEPSAVFTYCDWVASVAARGKHLLVAAGPDVYCHDLTTGQALRHFPALHEGNVTAVEGTQNSRILFTAGLDGKVLATDVRMKHPSYAVWHHEAGIHALAFEDPWLAAATSDGSVLLLNTETQAHRPCPPSPAHSPNCRRLYGAGGPVYCVDIGDQRVACGSEADRVRVFDFTGARAAADRAAAAKASRNTRKQGRKGASSAPVGAAGLGGLGHQMAVASQGDGAEAGGAGAELGDGLLLESQLPFWGDVLPSEMPECSAACTSAPRSCGPGQPARPPVPGGFGGGPRGTRQAGLVGQPGPAAGRSGGRATHWSNNKYRHPRGLEPPDLDV